jgi:hypothetical protein
MKILAGSDPHPAATRQTHHGQIFSDCFFEAPYLSSVMCKAKCICSCLCIVARIHILDRLVTGFVHGVPTQLLRYFQVNHNVVGSTKMRTIS